jgi:hypothetical protein
MDASPHARSVGVSLRLVLVVVRLYLATVYTTSVFSLDLVHHGSSNRLQHSVHSHISISHISLLSPNQHHQLRHNHFRIHFMDNEFEETN